MQHESQLVSIRAYQLWEEEGRPHGRDQAHWFEAERQLRELQATSQVETPLTRGLAERPSPSSKRGRRH
jgi:hypothetical protein